MPNPIYGYVKRTVNGNRKPLEPTPEKYAGDNVPYLGVNDHGVKPNKDFRDPADDLPVPPDGRLVDVYEHEAKEPDPIPVRVVNKSSRERRTFRPIRGYAGANSTAILILGQDDNRFKALIRVPTDGKTVWIGDDHTNANPTSGYPVAAGEIYITETQSAVYMSVDGPDPQAVYIAIECRLGIDG